MNKLARILDNGSWEWTVDSEKARNGFKSANDFETDVDNSVQDVKLGHLGQETGRGKKRTLFTVAICVWIIKNVAFWVAF